MPPNWSSSSGEPGIPVVAWVMTVRRVALNDDAEPYSTTTEPASSTPPLEAWGAPTARSRYPSPLKSSCTAAVLAPL